MAKHIIIFNDTQEILELFREILEPEGYLITLQSFSTHSFRTIKELQPDLIICDHTPSANEEKQGWQLVQAIRMSRATENIPVLICTTDIKRVTENEGQLASKGMLIIAKPFNIDELISSVENLIGKANEPELGKFHPLSQQNHPQEK